jgi:predicted regulator of Ras-like GTPase activity (Roadblock/LC7/MglB family)
MNIPFIRFFKKDKPEEGSVAVAPRPVTPAEKPASERLGKTVLPNSSRIVGIAPVENLPAQASPNSTSAKGAAASTRKISLGASGSVGVGPKVPAGEPAERTITLPMADLVAGIPSELLAMPVDTDRRIVLKAAEVERGMGTGRPTALLRTVYNQAPEFFAAEVPAADLREVSLPFAKVVEQFAQFQVRDDQITDQAGPQFETPFLQVTLEDNKRFETSLTPPVVKNISETPVEKGGGAKVPAVAEKGPAQQAVSTPKPSAPVRFSPPPTASVPATPDKAAATAAPAPAAAAAPTAKAPIRFSPPPVAPVPPTSEVPPMTDKVPVSSNQPPPAAAPTVAVPAPPKPSIPIKLSAPSPAAASPSAPTEKLPLPLEQSSAGPSTTAKLSPNGTGVPAAERVPASSGSPVPTPLPSPVPPPEPTRIPFKVGPPSNDLRPESKFPAARANPDAPDFSSSGPRISLPLRNILRTLAPFQLSGGIDQVPETTQIEIPFSIVQPQLALGRVAISPAQFKAALREEYRALFKGDDAGTPVPLLLQDVLQNLPSESLQLRSDQEDVEITPTFETPFSTKATEDAARMKVSAVPIGKTAATPEAAVPAPAPVAKAAPTPASTPAGPTAAAEVTQPSKSPTELFAKPPVAPIEPTAKAPIPPTAKTPIEPTAKAPIEAAKETPKAVTATKEEKPATKAPTAGTPVRRTALQNLFNTDEPLDAKTVLAHVSRLPGVSSCAIVFSDGLSLAGNIPADYEADALCAMAPSIMKRIGEQMQSANFGALGGVTLFCAKTQVSLFADGNICLATLHSGGDIAAQVRDRLGRTAQELARMYAQPA